MCCGGVSHDVFLQRSLYLMSLLLAGIGDFFGYRARRIERKGGSLVMSARAVVLALGIVLFMRGFVAGFISA
jgi:hypothetical protein